ncbi:MAG TPA: alpha/beta family hydrolase [Acidimicrobiales bacterium]|nr:alpha/beta family hydrolase [Acidimicrobiales bacterium]
MKKNLGLVLAPGAGGGADHSSLVAIEAVVGKFAAVSRVKFGSGKAESQVVKARGFAEELARAERLDADRIFVGGRSFGGRVFSMAAADGMPCAGLVLLSYPLHPPGKSDQLRTEHFPQIKVPCLFVSGTRDAFGSPEEIKRATKKIKGAVEHVWIEGGDHGMRGKDVEVAEAVAGWLKTSGSTL